MKLIDNINNKLGSDIEENLSSKSRLKIAASYFSIYAYAALKKGWCFKKYADIK